ncbi:serine palmitoyltransferase component [Coemansia sp. RSA 989]|nr:pyridoxal phosphate-dependent transferase [Coemansia mojavensis]KAJ1743908.1 serine palmitoyltransferase component [Coemansia sp. RSA 1086]KAJ1748324.1 serine palmitoyltransferase component [Coemansia sp. RSA 1821]KAJ1864237.1 serine palmitoyltransferase component [Coemansia sp. RSA 989]KAJ1870294.1 serine palmitoyltransferase component [Coemansia sp. RSA 990]KAJ2649987.1 serine palmitoyltransferase component [Coemansia sp. RSA 1250]KAJ2672817.1 serine palmitoyltransferase component [Coema
MGKGQRALHSFKSTEYIEKPRDKDGLVIGGDPFKLAPSTSASILSEKSASPAVAPKVSKAEVKASAEEKNELEAVPTFILVTTYLSFLMLIVFAHMRDFIGKLFHPEQYVQLRVQNGYAPMVSDFESLWTRRLYGRIRDCFNRPITEVAGGHVNLLERVSHDFNRTFEFTGRIRNVLNLASYNYLGFAQSEGPCADKVEEAMKEHGITQASSRSEAGRTRLLVETEEMVARFVGTEAALIVSMGYATNALNMPALVSKGCLIISDELNHSSLVSGARLSGATIRVFRHNNTADLEKQLRKSISQGQPRTHRPWKKILVVVEGLYSMEGEFCNLPKIIELKRKYGFYLYVDEAHSIGALGKRGRGICDHFGVDPREVDVLMGTFTKSFGAAGGYIAGSKALIDYLRVHSHSAVYAEAMSVPVLVQVSSSMRMIMGEDREHALEGQQRLDQLAINSRYFARRLVEMGFMTMGDPGSPVIPLLLFSPAKIPAFSRECLKRNIAVVVVSYPATPIITGRVRFCISASHTREDLDFALEQISEIGDLLMLKFHKDKVSPPERRIKTE